MSARLQVRLWQASDRDSLLELCREIHRECVPGFLPYDEGAMGCFLDGYLEDRENRCGLAAVENEVIIGLLAGYVAEYLFCHEWIACDDIFYVVPARRGSWAAPRLLGAFRDWARARGARELALGISSGVDPQRTGRFYERMGLYFVGGLYKQTLS